MEPVAWQVKILRKSESSSDLSPNPQVVQVNDSVFWANQTSEAHRPAPQGCGEWFIERDDNGVAIKDSNGKDIPQNVSPGQPSQQVQFQAAGVFPYQCNVHPTNQQEQGTVIVPAQLIQIRRSDDGNSMLYDAASVPAGSYVWWLNVDTQGQPHQPVFAAGSNPPGVSAPVLSTDMSAPIQFNTVGGPFTYTCRIHPNDPTDGGTVTVTTPPPPPSS